MTWSDCLEFGISFYAFLFYIGTQFLNLVFIHFQRVELKPDTMVNQRRYSMPAISYIKTQTF